MSSVLPEKILDTAWRLFYRNGIHATGVDTVVAEAGVNKMTLYKYFPSKQDLILAVLKRRDRQWREWFQSAIECSSAVPRERLLAIFDALAEWFRSDGFCGSAFINAAAEFADAAHPIHQEAADHIRRVRDYVEQLATDAGASDPAALAHAFCLLIEGAIVTAFVTGRSEIARDARNAAATLLSAHLTPGRAQR